jgi:hypothetical protein
MSRKGAKSGRPWVDDVTQRDLKDEGRVQMASSDKTR